MQKIFCPSVVAYLSCQGLSVACLCTIEKNEPADSHAVLRERFKQKKKKEIFLYENKCFTLDYIDRNIQQTFKKKQR